MKSIKKQIVMDESSQPVAVIINYQDWQKVEALLQQSEQLLLKQLEKTSAEVWSPQTEPTAIQALSDLLAAKRNETNA
ncbi:MAG: hypothetical protein SAJ12_20035, partial [Jaaginema sp. PMC 1079.18]|nr:hypothetical protein [Jaaginema sp. PMC 1080.18]MEC4853277.1 hypothetical protein [Jaaginema sp. PMC 1079.18]MEC4868595.1 hypothetical protein [Jaaginema sp. PMC 1078.18]